MRQFFVYAQGLAHAVGAEFGPGGQAENAGVLVFARTSKAASRLSRAFAARKVCKIYWGVLPATT